MVSCADVYLEQRSASSERQSLSRVRCLLPGTVPAGGVTLPSLARASSSQCGEQEASDLSHEFPLCSAGRNGRGHTHAQAQHSLTKTRFNPCMRYCVETDLKEHVKFLCPTLEKMPFDLKEKQIYWPHHFYRAQVPVQEVFSVHSTDTTVWYRK